MLARDVVEFSTGESERLKIVAVEVRRDGGDKFGGKEIHIEESGE